jgi:archaellum component FlaG (FlaF/FlaG flagellin family)
VGNATYKWFGPTGLNVGTDLISYVANAVVGDSGDYAIEVDQNGCKYYDTVNVAVQPQIVLANWVTDTAICVPDTITLDATASNYPVALYSWNTGASTPTISTFNRDTFTVTVTDTGNVCTVTDTVRVDWNITFPRVWEGNISTDWMVDRNWSCGGVPDSMTDVRIPDVTLTTGNEPIVMPGTDAKVRTIEMEPGSGIILRGYLWVNEP